MCVKDKDLLFGHQMKSFAESRLYRAFRVSRRTVWQMFYLPCSWVVSHVAPLLKTIKWVKIMRKARLLLWLSIIPLIILKRKVAPLLKLKTKGFPLPPLPPLLPKRKKVYYVYPKKKKFPLQLGMEENQKISINAWNISNTDAFPTLNRKHESSTTSTMRKDGWLEKIRSRNGVVVSRHGSVTTLVGNQARKLRLRALACKRSWGGWKRNMLSGSKNLKTQKRLAK